VLELDHKLLGIANPLEQVVVRPLFSFDLRGIEIVVSNHMFMVTLAAFLLLLVLPLAVRGKGLVRRGFGNLIETVYSFIREEMAGPFLGDRSGRPDQIPSFVFLIFLKGDFYSYVYRTR